MTSPSPSLETPPPDWIRIEGYQQVVDLLKAADPPFREALLRQVSQKNAPLAKSLRQSLEIENLNR